MSWVASLIAAIAAALIKMLGDDIANYVKAKKAKDAANAEIDKAAADSVAPLQNAKTGEEVANAARGAFDGT